MSLSQGDVCLSCPGSVDLGVLLPHLAGVIVEAVTAAAGMLLVTARARAPEAARHLGWGLHTVQRLDRAATWQELADGRWQGPRPSKLDPFKPYLDQHADGARGSIRRLFLEIKALGYDGSYPVVRDYLSRNSPARMPLPPAPPTVRDVTNWLCRRPGTLTEDERPRLKAILDAAPNCRPHQTRSARSPP